MAMSELDRFEKGWKTYSSPLRTMSARRRTNPWRQRARNRPVSSKTPHIFAVNSSRILCQRWAHVFVLLGSSSYWVGKVCASISFDHLSTLALVRYIPAPISLVSIDSLQLPSTGGSVAFKVLGITSRRIIRLSESPPSTV